MFEITGKNQISAFVNTYNSSRYRLMYVPAAEVDIGVLRTCSSRRYRRVTYLHSVQQKKISVAVNTGISSRNWCLYVPVAVLDITFFSYLH